MELYTEVKEFNVDYGDGVGMTRKTWNCCHPSGYAGKVIEDYYPNGQLQRRQYVFNGNYHRADGPAYESWDRNGRRRVNWYFTDGVEFIPLP